MKKKIDCVHKERDGTIFLFIAQSIKASNFKVNDSINNQITNIRYNQTRSVILFFFLLRKIYTLTSQI